MDFSEEARRLLLQLARESIHFGARHGRVLTVDLAQLPAVLHLPRASFVTLTQQGQLRGCIGSLIPRRPLAEDVIHNAFAAAFFDPRFPQVTPEEIKDLRIHLSVLSPLEEIPCRSEQELLAQIRPSIDGLVLRERDRLSTFLPAVWASLPDKRNFLTRLKMKAGLPPHYWSDELKVYRYTVEVID